MVGRLFSDEEVAFIAKTYRIVVLSLCATTTMNTSVADAIMAVSARLKAVNPSIKVLQYFNMQEWACYLPTDPQYATFLAHPEWWLRDDNGVPVSSGGPLGLHQYDFTNRAAVEHWLAMPTEDANGTALVDGFLLDGAGGYNDPQNVSASRAETLKLAMWRAVGQMQKQLAARPDGGIVVANGMIGGAIDPHVDDPFNLGVLEYAGGVENERGTPTFELVNGTNGAFLKDDVAANLAAIERASQLSNGTKVVAVNYWAGPFIGFHTGGGQGDNSNGFPVFAPGDPVNHTPNGTRAEVIKGWQAILQRWLPFNLAMFLSVAGPGTYFTQMVWYASFEGFVACPQAPDTCCAPAPFYPEMHRPLGLPMGPRVQVSSYKWVRHFEHAVVTVDLDEPLGPGTSIVWN